MCANHLLFSTSVATLSLGKYPLVSPSAPNPIALHIAILLDLGRDGPVLEDLRKLVLLSHVS